ncbi:MAG: 4Fe-4S binding protein [Syntrophales bacterium]
MNLRRAVQGFFLLLFLFLFLQTETKGDNTLGYPVKLFLDFDPLISFSSLLSSRAVTGAFFLSVLILLLTAVLGRVFCGWICPLGTLNNLAGLLKKKQKGHIPPGSRRIKYYLLIFLLASSLFTLQLTGIVDPLSLLIRSFSLSIYPLFNSAVRAVFETLYALQVPAVTDFSEWIYSILKKSVLSFQQPYFIQGVFLGLFFFVILALNLVEKRLWCKYLCPLGALLGVFSRFSPLRRSLSEGCNDCGLCSAACQGGALHGSDRSWETSECLYCMNCDDLCPHNAVSFGFGRPASTAMDLGRRNVISSFLAGIVAVPLLRTGPFSRSGYSHPKLIRPPGSLEEGKFLERCVKCGECMKVCVTNGLQPALTEAGLEGIWSPVLVPRMGYCEYGCTLCGQVCPTGAIRKLTPDEKKKTRIGLAVIDRGRCLPHSYSTPCIVCEEVCPTPKKAIWLEKVKVKDGNGKEVILRQPRVDLERCIGCGICETKCPVLGMPAIYITSLGESRSKENRLLL